MDEAKGIIDAAVTETPDFEVPPSPPTEIVSPEASPDAWQTVRHVALRHLDRFMSFEPKVLRGDDADAIHDIRVASRRLQQVVDLLYPQPRPKQIQRLRRQIRRCRRALGGVRNYDVQLLCVGRLLARKRAARREAWTAVRHYLLECRAASFEKALRRLSKLNLSLFYVHLKEYLSPEVTGSSTPASAETEGPAPESFSERVAQALERVWTAFENQVDLSHREARAPVIHRARVAAKRLRYLIEVIHEFEVPGSAESLGWLRQLQRHLGDWHDLEVLEQMMIAMVARPDFLREHLDLAMSVERLVVATRARKTRFQDQYFRMIRDAEEFRRVKEWVAYLIASPSAAFAKA